jgi:hypothetical protein
MVCNAPMLSGNSSVRVGENAHARALTLELSSGIRASGGDDGRQLNVIFKKEKKIKRWTTGENHRKHINVLCRERKKMKRKRKYF